MDDLRLRAGDYRRRVYGSDGSIRINHSQLENQVIRSDTLPLLSAQELQEVGYILCHMSRNPGLNAIIENDHREYWSFVNKVAQDSTIDFWIRTHHPLRVVINSDLVMQLKPKYQDQGNRQWQNTLMDSFYGYMLFPAVWSGFSYLEGICRRICHDFIDEEGEIKKAFRVNGRQYRSARGNRYVTGRRKGYTKISSLCDLLVLTRRKVSPHTRHVLASFFRDYSASDIYSWRNACLHGIEDESSVFIVIYSLISILLLDPM